MVKDLIGRSGSNYKLCCLMDERVIEARDSVARQSVDIAIDVTRLSVECKGKDDGNNKDKTGPADTLQGPAAVIMMSVEYQGEQDDGNNKEKIGPADTLQVTAAVMPNFNMEIAANELVDKKGPVVQLDVPGVIQTIAVDTLGDIGLITPNKVSVFV